MSGSEKLFKLDVQYNLIIIASLVLWITLLLLGMPDCNIDDFTYVGAALTFCKTGHLANPLLRTIWPDQATRFFMHFPLHQLLLGYWLKIFGISTFSMLSFQCACFILFTICILLVLKRFSFSPGMAFLVVLIYANFIIGHGMREDALGLAFWALGLLMLADYSFLRYVLAAFFLGLGVMAWPTGAGYALSFALMFLLVNAGKNENRKAYWCVAAPAILVGALVTAIVFLLTINFRVALFFHDYLVHASIRRTPTSMALAHFFDVVTQDYGWFTVVPVFILFLFFALIAWRKDKVELRTRLLMAATAAGVAINILLYCNLATLPAFFLTVCLLAFVFDLKDKGLLRLVCLAGFVPTAMAVYALPIYSGLFVQRNLPGPNDENFPQIRRYAQEHPDRLYAIDDVAARFVFDYKLPPDSVDWVACYLWHGFRDYDRLKCIVSAQKRFFDPLLPADYSRLRILGHACTRSARVVDPIIMYDLPAQERTVPRYLVPPSNQLPDGGNLQPRGQ